MKTITVPLGPDARAIRTAQPPCGLLRGLGRATQAALAHWPAGPTRVARSRSVSVDDLGAWPPLVLAANCTSVGNLFDRWI